MTKPTARFFYLFLALACSSTIFSCTRSVHYTQDSELLSTALIQLPENQITSPVEATDPASNQSLSSASMQDSTSIKSATFPAALSKPRSTTRAQANIPFSARAEMKQGIYNYSEYRDPTLLDSDLDSTKDVKPSYFKRYSFRIEMIIFLILLGIGGIAAIMLLSGFKGGFYIFLLGFLLLLIRLLLLPCLPRSED